VSNADGINSFGPADWLVVNGNQIILILVAIAN